MREATRFRLRKEWIVLFGGFLAVLQIFLSLRTLQLHQQTATNDSPLHGLWKPPERQNTRKSRKSSQRQVQRNGDQQQYRDAPLIISETAEKDPSGPIRTDKQAQKGPNGLQTSSKVTSNKGFQDSLVPLLTAYLEEPNLDEWEMQPLPNRSKASKPLLQMIQYPRVNSCRNLPGQLPVNDSPTDADPFLPWIHDVFPTDDGKFVQFVAQNKRRCHTGQEESDLLRHYQPQAALFQNAPVQRFVDPVSNETRYRLSSYQDADFDAHTARFICRFKSNQDDGSIIRETLSVFNFDYDYASYRKRYRGFQKDEGNMKQIHTSQLLFRCPVPLEMQASVQSLALSETNDWTHLFVDLIPIRTPPRYGAPHQFFQPKYQELEDPGVFNVSRVYGTNHVLPRIQDSGRLENIPLCPPSWNVYGNSAPLATGNSRGSKPNSKHQAPTVATRNKHRLVSCLWTSSGYMTRGNRFQIKDGPRRLLEWITYSKLMGFDHFYIYDNSLAQSNHHSTLRDLADQFPDDITYINWPSQICNNRRAKDDSPGERSSQYAAESSCRLRFGPYADWIGQFDIDEYFIPQGSITSAKDLVDALDQQDVRAVSFLSQRTRVRREFMDPPQPFKNKTICRSPAPCFYLTIPANVTFLQAHNCDQYLPGHKIDPDPAEKQLYRPDYVLQHFIHYSAVTTFLDKNRTETEKEGFPWKHRGKDPRIRYANEMNEGLMLHAKSVAVEETAAFHRRCHFDNLQLPPRRRGECFLGLPWPENMTMVTANATNEDGLLYNCHVNERIEEDLVPRLQAALRDHKKEKARL